MKRCLVPFLILVLSVCRLSAKEQFIFTHISQTEGLTSTVNCIYKEKNGDVWLGAPNGLYRFNGYAVKHYNDGQFSGREVFQIAEDTQGDLWVLTSSWPAVRHKGKNEFHDIRIAGAEKKQVFNCMCQDKDGIWFGGYGKVFRYSYKDHSLCVFKEITDKPVFNIREMLRYDARTLLCCSRNGIILLDTQTGEYRDASLGSFKEVSACTADSMGNIWIAFYNNGIEVYDRSGNLVKRYNTTNSTLSNNVVLCLTERESCMWAGTDGGGLNIINPKTDQIRILSHISGDHSSFPAHSIKSLFTDAHGNIWAGSIRDGLIRVRGSEMKTYSDSHIGQKTGLSNQTVLSLYQDSYSDYIWIGTDGEGLNRYNSETNEFTHYTSTLKTKVVSIAEYSEEELALSVFSDRIWLFDKRTGLIRPLEIDDELINYSLKYSGRSVNLVNEKDGSLIFISNHIHRFDKKTGKCAKIDVPDRRNGEENIFVIGRSNKGLWFHDNHDIYHLDRGAMQMVKKAHLGDYLIRSGYICRDGLIWLATDNGLYKFNPDEDSFKQISTTVFTNATSVVCDRHSRVWVGTEQKLFAYIRESGSVTMFGASDGAAPNEYLSRPRLVARDGDVFMGGVQGLLCINDEFSVRTTEIPVLKLYSLFADEVILPPEKGMIYEIPRHSNTLRINLSVLEKDIFRDRLYRFSFSDNGPTFQSASPTLKIQQMPKAGKYDLMVSCTKRNGEWASPVRVATIIIKQPWYLSAWFLGSIMAALAFSIGTYFVAAANRKANRLQLALKEQEQMVYEEKVRLLINISHELRTPLTLIMAPLKRLLKDMEPGEENFGTLNRIYRQAKRMKNLLNMVLDLRKMEVGKNNLKIEKIRLNQWITDTIADFVAEESAEGIEIVSKFDSRVDLVEFDRQKCDTVMMNVLMNAIKHSTDGDTIIISTTLEEDKVRITVTDQGPGLKDIDPTQLFTSFYQGSSEQYGSGIGLSYSKILVELHGGEIGAENNPDVGATFWWTLPIKYVHAEVMDVPARAYLNELMGYDRAEEVPVTEEQAFRTSGMRMMLVDDNQDLLEFIREALCEDFAEVITVTSGNKALALLSNGNLPDIIVSDINMPDGDGFSLCRALKANDKYNHIPIVLLTAREEEQTNGDFYRLGADGFMSKPFEVETLLELMRNILRHKAEIRKSYFGKQNEVASQYGSNEEQFILRLNRIIAEHMSDPELDQMLLCRELGVSRALLYKKMRAITGAGAKEYITKIRLEKAKYLIETTSLPILEISEMTGFASQSYFSTAFKSHTGMSPSQYKKRG